MSESGQRKRFFIDSKIQGALLRQLIWHWFVTGIVLLGYLFLLDVFASDVGGSFVDHLKSVWSRYASLLMVLATMFPVFLYDSMRLSHRFVGPMVSLRRHLRRLADGEAVTPLRFRDGDFWQDLTMDFNRLVDRVARHQPAQQTQR